MLVLSRKKTDAIVINGTIKIKVLRITGNTICLGIEAPPDVSIRRSELEPLAVEEERHATAPRAKRPVVAAVGDF